MVYFRKSYPAPASLACEKLKGLENGDYKKEDVITQIKKDFYDKCYICESKGIQAINIEHFEPHENRDIDKKFAWDNLFWACSHCNGIKSNTHINLLNCTKVDDEIDNKIKYDTNFKANVPSEKIIIEAIAFDQKTQNTVNLLKSVYQGISMTDLRKHQASTIRESLFNELNDFQYNINKYFFTQYEDEKDTRLLAIIKHLKNSTPYTAFKRYIIRNDSEYLKEFSSYIID